jgi:hypothetical protein
MKSTKPTKFEKQHAMRVPLIRGTCTRLPKPQYQKMSRADLEIAAAAIRATCRPGAVAPHHTSRLPSQLAPEPAER